jgi:capsid protein
LTSDSAKKAFADYARLANEVIADWFLRPDLQEELSGVEILRQDIMGIFGAGNSFVHVTADDAVGPREVQLRWNVIEARRILNTTNQASFRTASGDYVTLGIVRDKYGKKKKYLVQQPNDFGSYTGSTRFAEIPKKDMIHRYIATEPGQFLGVPMIAAAMPVIADLRQFDKLTMEAAKLSASFGIAIEDKFDATKTGSSAPKRSTTVVPTVRRGMAEIVNLPHNKEAVMLDPKHPGTQYVPYRTERMRDIGRAFQMPLLLVRLGAEEHSYSSARFDAQVYKRAIRTVQQDIVRKYGPSIDMVLKEAEMLGLLPRRPVPIDVSAVFAPLPHVDPAKEQEAIKSSLDSMSTTILDVWQQSGQRPEDMVYRLKESRDLLNQVMDGLGDAALVAKLGKIDPRVLAQFDIVDRDLLEGTDKAVPAF